jgi:hypothetical protein
MGSSDHLISNGEVRTGIFSEPVTVVDPAAYDLRSPLGKKLGRRARHFGYKQFHYVGGISNDLIFGATVVDLRYLSSAFYYIYDLKTGKELRHTWRTPFSRAVRFSTNPESCDVSYGNSKNGITIRSVNGDRLLSVRKGGRLLVDASFADRTPAVEPLRICTRAGYTGWVYVRKTGAVPMKGTIDCEFGRFDIENCLGHTDYSAGYMRPETWWNWAFVSGSVDGKRFGLNVSCGVNETSYSENCAWVDGKLSFLPQTRFEFDAADPMKDWRIHSDSFDLRFMSRGVHKEHVNAGLLATRFSQMYGTFRGKVQLGPRSYEISDLYGFAEDHYARW